MSGGTTLWTLYTRVAPERCGQAARRPATGPFVHSVGRGDYADYVLDLDVLYDAGNPTVAHWAFKEWEISEHQQYWDWLDSTGTNLVFGP